MLARTLLTGLREDEEDDEDEVLKLDAEDASRQPELLNIELLDVWGVPIVGRIERDLAVFRVRVCVSAGACSC